MRTQALEHAAVILHARTVGHKKQMMQYPVARGCDQGTLDAPTAMVEQIGANGRKNETLSGLRDALLPKLMAGVIDVPEVES